ncbi:MAG: MFS transporter [Lentisphaeraceae bacterium]|nr:MFS transporter [Lentisphaeraceae bacterium]
MISDDHRRKAQNSIILSQCFGQVAPLCFANGLMLSYLDYQNVSEQAIVLFLKTPSIISLMLILPIAYFSDLYGKKKLGQIGNILQSIAFMGLCFALTLASDPTWLILLSIVCFAFGVTLFNGSWFALLDPVILPQTRGSFFAKMRTCWKFAGVTFTFFVQYLLEKNGHHALSTLLLCVALFCLIRMFFYQRIPELEPSENLVESKKGLSEFKSRFMVIFEDRPYRNFCIFKFLFPVITSCTIILVHLYLKEYLNYDHASIVFIGNVAFIGAIVGFSFGALLLKKLGMKKGFLYSSIAMATTIILLPFHGVFSFIPVELYFSGLIFLEGVCAASFGISVTSIMLDLLPQKNKSMSTSMFLMCQESGSTVAAITAATLISTFAESNYVYRGVNINVYSVLLILSGILTPILTYLFIRQYKVTRKS